MLRRNWLLPALAVAFLVFAGCGSRSQAPAKGGGSQGPPEQAFRGVQLRESSQGKLQWDLRATRATRLSANGPTRLDSLEVLFYQGGPTVRSTLTSDSGRVDLDKGTLIAMGNVVVITPDGKRLETEVLNWDRKKNQVFSDAFVRVISERDVVTGIGFRSDPNIEHYQILKDVRATLRDESLKKDALFGPDSGGTGH
jgi:LPS export ABC transporter protein LptC